MVFCAMGISGAMATTLVPVVRVVFGLNLAGALAVQWLALVVSALASLPLAGLLQRQGAARMTVAGLLLVTLGCIAVWPAMLPPGVQRAPHYGVLLGALAVVALGNTALQMACNLLVIDLGDPAGGPARLTLAQGFNSLGVMAGVHLGAAIMLGAGGGNAADAGALAHGAALAYMCCAAVSLVALALWAALPKSATGSAQHTATPAAGASFRRAFACRWALAGAAAIALYVGAEGAIGSILISFLHQDAVLALPLSAAGRLVANVYWGGALAGRFAGGWLLRGRSELPILTAAALLAALACLVALAGSGLVAAAAALAIGLLNAVMFPVIFAATLARSPAPPAAVSGLLTMATGGSALISLAVGWAGDRFGIGTAFAVPLCAYLLIALFALIAGASPAAARPPQDSRMTNSVGRRSDLI